MINRKLKSKLKNNQLTIDFGLFSQQQRLPSKEGLFQKVRSEMLKRRERSVLRRKPLEYERLQSSLQAKLKQKIFNKQEERIQIVMLDKCKSYFQLRKPKRLNRTTNNSRYDTLKRPQTSSASFHGGTSALLGQLQSVMNQCESDSKEIKEDMHLFTFYCRMMDRRLEGIRNTIEKKERMA